MQKARLQPATVPHDAPEAEWSKALERERALKTLPPGPVGRAEIARLEQTLQLSRTQIYRLVRAFRAAPQSAAQATRPPRRHPSALGRGRAGDRRTSPDPLFSARAAVGNGGARGDHSRLRAAAAGEAVADRRARPDCRLAGTRRGRRA